MPIFRPAPARALLSTLSLCIALCAQAAAAPVPLTAFFDNSKFSAALLSPDARYLAVRVGAPDRRDSLVVLKLEDLSGKSVASFDDADIGNFEWVNDHRLVFDTTDRRIGSGDVEFSAGMYAVDHDGTRMRQLVARRGADYVQSLGRSKELLPPSTYLLRQRGAQDGDEIYVQSVKFDGPFHVKYVDMLRLNTVTGKTSGMGRPPDTVRWLLDGQGEPRLAISRKADTQTIHYRDPASGAWRPLASKPLYGAAADGFEPLGFSPDGTLYVTAHAGQDQAALYRYDLARNALDAQALVRTKGFDFTGVPLSNHDKLLGVRFVSDAESTVWFDPAMKTLQAEVDARLPDTINHIDVAARAATPWVLVTARSDKLPTIFLLYNTAEKRFSKVGDSHPEIQPKQMGRLELVHYKARDGLDIPAWLTLPAGATGKNLPLVVLVHGGPYVRGGAWGWHAEQQFLASRGYAVLEPEFRGSTGYGSAHFKAGWKQWGLAMQDDIADGTRWAIAQGIVDPKRICIAGASYGGYATLMGLIKDPDLYKCGVDWVGVTDINLLYNGKWNFQSDLPEEWKQYGMPELIGDQVKDAAQFKATSPLEQAARLTQPVLLAYGGADVRVPIFHGLQFYEAVKPTNPNVEWIEYPDEGHGWAVPKNRIDFWNRVEKFLDKNIGAR